MHTIATQSNDCMNFPQGHSIILVLHVEIIFGDQDSMPRMGSNKSKDEDTAKSAHEEKNMKKQNEEKAKSISPTKDFIGPPVGLCGHSLPWG